MKIIKTANYNKKHERLNRNIATMHRSELPSEMLKIFYESDILFSNYGNESALYTVAQYWLSEQDVSTEMIQSAINEIQLLIRTQKKRGRQPVRLKILSWISDRLKNEIWLQKNRTINQEKCIECGEMKHVSEFSSYIGTCQSCADKLERKRKSRLIENNY